MIFIIISMFIIYFIFTIIESILKWPIILILSIGVGIKLNNYYLTPKL